MITSAEEMSLNFLRSVEIAKETYSFFFSKPENFVFNAGQYGRFSLELDDVDPRGFKRPFTLCSSPLDDELMITTKIAELKSPFKKKLKSLEEGDKVTFFGPLGNFVLPEQSDHSIVLLAGGIGITPFHSMLRLASKTNYSIPTTLIASFSSIKEIIFFKELTETTMQNSYLQAVYTITHLDGAQNGWVGEKGRISEEMIKRYVADYRNSLYYLCGPEKMVLAMEELVKDMNVADSNIRKENITGY